MQGGRRGGGPSRVPMGFWNLEVEDYFIFIQIYRRFHFSGEKLTDRLLPPSRATLTVGDTCVWFMLVSAFAPCPAALSPGVWAHGVSSVLNKHDTFLHTAGSGPRQRHPGPLGTRHSPFLKPPARKTDPHILCGSFFFFVNKDSFCFIVVSTKIETGFILDGKKHYDEDDPQTFKHSEFWVKRRLALLFDRW